MEMHREVQVHSKRGAGCRLWQLPIPTSKAATDRVGQRIATQCNGPPVRIPRDGDQRSELMSITIPK
jgi:hypothetical protein